jgi:hypothetical protein
MWELVQTNYARMQRGEEPLQPDGKPKPDVYQKKALIYKKPESKT